MSNISYSYTQAKSDAGTYSGSPILHNGDTITAHISDATPGGVVRINIAQRSPLSPVVDTVVGNVGSDGTFNYTYTVDLERAEFVMYQMVFSVDSWQVSAGTWGMTFLFVVGAFSTAQITSSPFTTVPTELPTNSPYYIDLKSPGIINPAPPPPTFDVTYKAPVVTVHTGNPVVQSSGSQTLQQSIQTLIEGSGSASSDGGFNWLLIGGVAVVGYLIFKDK